MSQQLAIRTAGTWEEVALAHNKLTYITGRVTTGYSR
jgi:hypothetical protein